MLPALFYPISEAALLGLARYHFEGRRYPAEVALSPRVQVERGFVMEPARGKVLRVGYMSGDMTGNSIWREMIGVVQAHSRERVEVWCLPLMAPAELRSQNARDARDKMRTACTHGGQWLEIGGLDTRGASNVINQASIHVIVDVQGWTRGHSLSLLATRPAPIQVSYKNFVGTLGAPDHVPWLLTDRIVTPVEYSQYYSESLVLLPGSYYAAGHHLLSPYNKDLKPVQNLLSRSEQELKLLREAGAGDLARSGFVFGGFSNLGKVRPRFLYAWFRILQRVPSSYLWLTREPPFQARSLLARALQANLSSSLFLSDRLPVIDHMAIKRFAALYLDTAPFNGHSTSVEALWSGLPVLSLPSIRMAGRVGASVLAAVGMGSVLVARNLQDYEDIAVAVSGSESGVTWLERKRARLLLQRSQHSLFDVARWTFRTEGALRTMWELLCALGDGDSRHIAML